MAKDVFFMTVAKDQAVPDNKGVEQAVRAVIDEYGVPTYGSVADILADPGLKDAYRPSETRNTVRITVEAIDEKEFLQ